MIDRGLALSVGVVVLVVVITRRLRPPRTIEPRSLLDALIPPVLVGGLVGRLTYMALDDLDSFVHVRDVLIIRGGVEFWAALLVGIGVAARRASRDGCPPVLRLVDLAPVALWAMAAYDATCLLREGCFGPESPIGLRPTGLGQPVIPLGLLSAGLLVVAGVVVRRRWPHAPLTTLVAALTFVALVRAIASFWLPKFGSLLTRQHVESIVVAAAGMAATVVLVFTHGLSQPHDRPDGVDR